MTLANKTTPTDSERAKALLGEGEYSLDQLRAMISTAFLPAHAADYYGAVKQLFAVLTERAAAIRGNTDGK